MPDSLERLKTALAGRYQIERELGSGGMAVVYLALDLKHERRVAIKVLRPEVAAALGPERFLREIKLTARLSHPHILPLLDSGEGDGFLYYVMPFVAGESLRERLNRVGRLPLEEALSITREVADALASAHRHGVVHRDIKPENILLEEGHAVIADFGIARAVAASGGERLTATGLAVGTPIYMSPEQLRGDPVDERADIYSLACVLYELLAGEPPFSGPSVEAVIARRLSEAARPISTVASDVPEHVDRALRRALADTAEQRFATATHFAQALATPGWTTPPSGLDFRALLAQSRNPRVAIPAALLLVGGLALVVLPLRQRLSRQRAALLVPEIARLAETGRPAEAYDLAVQAERTLGDGDSTLGRLMPLITDRLTIVTEPASARVYLQRFAPDSAGRFPDSAFVGETPVRSLRVPRVDHRVIVVKEGFAPLERIASSGAQRALLLTPQTVEVTLELQLRPADQVPADMVFVPGGRYELVNPDAPAGLSADLADFLIDRHEVTNEQYRTFIVGGGYAAAASWPARFAHAGATFAADAARRPLSDRTGLPGPRSWVAQQFPAGQERHPVTDVSWYEASAYCASVGKRLPTVFEWDKTARDGQITPIDLLMPWGYLTPGEGTTHRANLGASGAVPVDRHPFGISPYGAYAMAGNVKEWLLNSAGSGYLATGGSWEDPVYVYSEYGVLSPFASGPTLGFRCARTAGPAGPEPAAVVPGTARIDLAERTPRYTPVDAATFRTLLSHYAYDRRPLEAALVETVETSDWTRETVRYLALEGDTAVAYLFLPKQAAPPFQTMVYVPSTGGFTHSVAEEVEWLIGPNIRAGRAAFAVVFQGMAGRSRPPGWRLPEPSSVRFRDLMVLHATELSRGLDYLETRPDMDPKKLAYVGLSWGAGSRLVLAGVDRRFAAVIFVGGGIDERVHPTLPEASNINFAPHIRAPKLLLNGRHDEEHPWNTRALPLWNLLREPKQLVLVDGAGHVPPLEARVPAINQFLDRTLGPVKAR